MSVLVIGASTSEACGVRAHARLLDSGLAEQGIACAQLWATPDRSSLSCGLASFADWSRAVRRASRRMRADAVLLHYSVFAFSHRGVPVFVPQLMSALADAKLPVLGFMHELAYPFGSNGLRGSAWAFSQRAALLGPVRRSSAIVVTADFRADWLRRQSWLPARKVAVAPVFSNLPDVLNAQNRGAIMRRPASARLSIGMFGYAHEGTRMDLVLDALGRLNARGGDHSIALRLLGAPGPDSPAAHAWRQAAISRGVEQALSFSGLLSEGDLAMALAGCGMLLFADRPGPTSRKGTLAAALASGRPVLAMHGPMTWPALRRANALKLVPQSAPALAGAIKRLTEDPQGAAELGARGRRFYEQQMSLCNTAEIVAGLLRSIAPGLRSEALAR